MAQPAVPRARRIVLAMKAETTYGTDVFAGTYTAGDIIPAFNHQPNIAIEEIPNLSMAGDLGRLPSVIGVEQATVAFSMYFRGISPGPFDDAPTRTSPEADRPWRGCGLAATFSVANGA